MYKVSFYTPSGKVSPIHEFLGSVTDSTRAKIITKTNYLKFFGLSRDVPDLKKVGGTPIWELRILGKDNIRLFCIPLPNKEVVILHIFIKKKQKTPRKDLKLALTRFKEIQAQTLDK